MDFCEKDWLRLLRETKLLTAAEIVMMVRKTAEKAFCRNAQVFSREEFTIRPLTATVRDFWEVRYVFALPLRGLSQSIDAIVSSTLLFFFEIGNYKN